MRHMPRVALVGRPNVGKSTLYNRLIGQRRAVVAPVAGTTRDRLEHSVKWEGRQFVIMDMAGLEPSLSEDTEIARGTQAQVERALADADAIIWVVDGRQGVTQSDSQIASLLRTLNKPILIAVNKADHSKHDDAQYDFAQFGFEETVALSALNGRGSSHLLDRIMPLIPFLAEDAELEEVSEVRIAIVGRPNVGKSTLLNKLVGNVRSVVSGEAGTTRDSVDTVIPASQFIRGGASPWKYVRIIDTAGIRRRGKIEMGVESWSLVRTLDAVDQAEVVLLLVDATSGLAMQDLHIAQKILEAGRPLALLVNKWDAILTKKHAESGSEEDAAEQDRFLTLLRGQAPFLHWVQVLFLSAEEGLNLPVVGKLVLTAYNAWSFTTDQDELDALAAQLRTTPLFKNLQQITLEHNQPPVFHLHVEGKNLPHFSTHRAAENVLRDYFDLGPTPIKIWTVTSVQRRHKK